MLRAHSRDLTALGVAIAAGQAEGINAWDLGQEFRETVPSDTFLPTSTEEERNERYKKWKMAVQRSLGWVTPKTSLDLTEERYKLLSSIPASLFVISSFSMLALAEALKESASRTSIS